MQMIFIAPNILTIWYHFNNLLNSPLSMKNSFNWQLGVGGGGQGQEYVSAGNLCILHLSNPNNAKFTVTLCSPISDSRPRIWYTDLVQPIWLVFCEPGPQTLLMWPWQLGIISHCLGMEPSLVYLYICTYFCLSQHLNVSQIWMLIMN